MSQDTTQTTFEALFERYKNLVYKTAYLMLNDPVEAEDALQEVFLLVHKALPGYDPARAALTTWLYRITLNHCLNRRRRRRLPVLPLDETLPVEATAGRFEEADTVGQTNAVAQAISRLSDKLRAVVILRYYGDLSYAEMTDVLGVPLGTVKSRLNLALKTLRPLLQEQDESLRALAPEKEGNA